MSSLLLVFSIYISFILVTDIKFYLKNMCKTYSVINLYFNIINNDDIQQSYSF